jgi:DNA-directed RNA polymerase specialized sigma24 family protein
VVPGDAADELLHELPFPYAAALRLARAGVSQEIIAKALAIEPEGVPAVMRLARAKLETITAQQARNRPGRSA